MSQGEICKVPGCRQYVGRCEHTRSKLWSEMTPAEIMEASREAGASYAGGSTSPDTFDAHLEANGLAAMTPEERDPLTES